MAAIEPPTGNYYSDDEAQIAAFLVGVGRVLGIFVEMREILLPPYMRAEFVDAWPDTSDAIDDCIAVLQNERYPEFRRYVPEAIKERRPEQLHLELQLVGLTGSHLKLKLTIFWYFYDLVMGEPSFMSVVAEAGAQAETTKMGRFKAWSVKKILEIINSMLGSLARVLSISEIIMNRPGF